MNAKILHSLFGLIFKDDLDIKQYELPDLHETETDDSKKRLDFCYRVKGLPINDRKWFIFPDEAYF
jgi:hypothetical protein